MVRVRVRNRVKVSVRVRLVGAWLAKGLVVRVKVLQGMWLGIGLALKLGIGWRLV